MSNPSYPDDCPSPEFDPMPEPEPRSYRIHAEAVGGTKDEALAYLLRIAAALAEDPSERGHTCGGTGGNASARIEAIY